MTLVVPHNLEAEESVLGAMLLKSEVIDSVSESLTAMDFYQPSYGTLFDTMVRLRANGSVVDAITVHSSMEAQGLLSHLPDPTILIRLQASVPSIGHATHYAKIVMDNALRRQMIATAMDLVNSAKDMSVLVEDTLDDYRTILGGLGSSVVHREPDDVAVEDFVEQMLTKGITNEWVVPKLIRRGHKVMIVAPEGAGKSWVLRYIAVCAAYGVRPFRHTRTEPIRTLIVDCVDTETQVMTQHGWRNYDEIKVGDKILTLNAENQVSEWKAITNLVVRSHSGEMVKLSQRNLDAMTTPNHRWFVDRAYTRGKIEVVTADNLLKTHRIPLCRPLRSNANGLAWPDDQVALAGWYLTDGHHLKVGQGIYITQSPHANPQKCKIIESHLDELGVKWGMSIGSQKTRPANVYYFTGAEARAIRAACPDRTLTAEFVVALNSHQREILFDSMVLGDGCFSGNSTSREFGSPYSRTGFGTSNYATVQAFEMLCCLLGRTPSVQKKENMAPRYYAAEDRWITATVPFYWVNVKSGGWTTLAETKIEKVNVVDQTVWCPTTDNGSFLAKRDGVVYFTGNCENPSDSLYDSFSAILKKVTTFNPQTETVNRLWWRPQGMNLRNRVDLAEFENVLQVRRPDLVCLGPLYAVYENNTRESWETGAIEVQKILKRLIVRYNFALMLEDHAPQSDNQGKRHMRPYGSSMWLRWPDIGIGMEPIGESGNAFALTRWRGDRVPNDWPTHIERGVATGSPWPFEGRWDRDDAF